MGPGTIVHVMPKPGVTDPEARAPSSSCAISATPSPMSAPFGPIAIEGPEESLPRFIQRVLANDAVEMTVRGTLTLDRLDPGQTYRFRHSLGADP